MAIDKKLEPLRDRIETLESEVKVLKRHLGGKFREHPYPPGLETPQFGFPSRPPVVTVPEVDLAGYVEVYSGD